MNNFNFNCNKVIESGMKLKYIYFWVTKTKNIRKCELVWLSFEVNEIICRLQYVLQGRPEKDL